MKLIDANLLIYAVNEDEPRHPAARRWLEKILSGTETIGFAWSVLLAFLRLSTRSGAFARPLSAGESLDIIESWLAQPCATVVDPGERHTRILRDLLEPPARGGSAFVRVLPHLLPLVVVDVDREGRKE